MASRRPSNSLSSTWNTRTSLKWRSRRCMTRNWKAESCGARCERREPRQNKPRPRNQRGGREPEVVVGSASGKTSGVARGELLPGGGHGPGATEGGRHGQSAAGRRRAARSRAEGRNRPAPGRAAGTGEGELPAGEVEAASAGPAAADAVAPGGGAAETETTAASPDRDQDPGRGPAVGPPRTGAGGAGAGAGEKNTRGTGAQEGDGNRTTLARGLRTYCRDENRRGWKNKKVVW
mmetsp:Transcript_1232/g.2725  ORF Transcript_1232/g.2725 Transcript_1232/m.2725 type:complete len:235 (-) Transcript_1232:417-1121(-)